MAEGWRNMKYGSGISVRKLTAEYCLSSDDIFPYRSGKIRIWLDTADGLYYAFGNVHIRGTDGTADSICGMGNSEEAALDDYITYYLRLVSQYEEKLGRRLCESDYEYSDPQDF